MLREKSCGCIIILKAVSGISTLSYVKHFKRCGQHFKNSREKWNDLVKQGLKNG